MKNPRMKKKERCILRVEEKEIPKKRGVIFWVTEHVKYSGFYECYKEINIKPTSPSTVHNNNILTLA